VKTQEDVAAAITMSDAEVDFVLERFDQTEPALQRRIVAQLVNDLAAVKQEHASHAAMAAEIGRLRADRDRLLAACKRILVFENWKHMLGDENRAASYLDSLDGLRAAIAASEVT
jgi:hypothetical protein